MQDQSKDEIKITLLASTDIHGRYFSWNYALDQADFSGSLSQISQLVKKIRAENPETILLEAGDLIQDNSAELFKNDDPHPAMIALNAMNYDAWTVGNHEFDYGIDVLDQIVAQFEGDFLGGNVYSMDGNRYYPAYTTIERAGVKLGIIGMTSPLVADFNEENNIFTDKEVRNPVRETQKVMQELEGKVDAVIGLMHMGIENENQVPDSGAADLVKMVSGFDAIFTGHMHSLKNEELEGVLLVQPNAYGTHLARLDLNFERIGDGFKLISKATENIPVESFESDQELEVLLHPFHKRARKDANLILGEIVGMDMVPPDEIKGIPQVQIQETPLTNFFNEVMLFYSEADVVAHQIDTDFARLDKGPVKKKDLAHNYQYINGEVSVFKVTGKDLKDYMEWSAAFFNQAKEGDLTISFDPERRAAKYSSYDIFGGVQYQIDLRKKVGDRIQNLRYLNDKEIKASDDIKLGINAYRMKFLVSKGGPLTDRKFLLLSSTQSTENFGEIKGRIRNLAARYLQEEMNDVYHAHLNHHWEIIGINKEHPAREALVYLVNQGMINVPSDDQRHTNIAPINALEKVKQKEIDELARKANINPKRFKDCQTKGEFYRALFEKIK